MSGINERVQGYLDRETGSSIFGSDISGYEIARLGYPDALYDTLSSRAGRVDSVLEIGPGTGLATFALLERLRPVHFVGVEADPALAAFLRAKISRLGMPDQARIEHCRFEDFVSEDRFDFTCCAAAFHWLDPVKSFASLRQLLKPGGVLALWWNAYRVAGVGDEFADRIAPLLATIRLAPSESEGRHYSQDIDFHRREMAGAGFDRFEWHSFRRERTLTTEDVVNLYLSYSYIRALPGGRRASFVEQVRTIAENEFGGVVKNSVITSLYISQSPKSGPAGNRPS